MTNRWTAAFKGFVVVALALTAIWLTYQARAVITPIILALLLTYIITLPVRWILRHTGWPRAFVVASVEIIFLGIFILTPVLVMPWLVNTLTTLGNTLVNVVQELLEVTPKPIVISPSLVIDLGPFYQPINQWLRGLLGADATSVGGLSDLLAPFASGAALVVRGAVSGILWFLFVMVTSFYVARDGPRLGRFLHARVPEHWRPELKRLWRELGRIWDAFVRGQLLLALIIGLVVWLVNTVLGVRSAAALGLVAAFLEFVPGLGPVIAAVPAILIAFFFGPTWLPVPNGWFAVIVAVAYFVIQQVENLYLLPRVVGRRVALHPAIVIAGAMVGAQMGGVLGILLAAPVLAAARVLLGYTYDKLLDQEPFPEPERPPNAVLLWPELIRERAPRGILFDLDGTLVETDDGIVRRLADKLAFLGSLLPMSARQRVARRWLMAGEAWTNGLITLLDTLRLDGLAFRLEARSRRLSERRAKTTFVPVSGTLALMPELRRRQWRLAIVTTRDRREALDYLAQFDIEHLFMAVVGRDDVRRVKPHPLPVREAARRLGLPVTQCVLVGDTGVDVRSAKAAGALAVGVLCGFGQEDDFTDADLVLPTPAQLVEWLGTPILHEQAELAASAASQVPPPDSAQ